MKNILFDFDGTVMDTWPGIETTLRASLKALDISVPDAVVTRALVGIPLMRVFEVLLDGDTVKAALATKKYRELFTVVGMSGASPFEGVLRMLEGLKMGGREVFLVTARNEMITKQMMKDHSLARFFTWVRGEQEGEVLDGKGQTNAGSRDHCELVFTRRNQACQRAGEDRHEPARHLSAVYCQLPSLIAEVYVVDSLVAAEVLVTQ